MYVLLISTVDKKPAIEENSDLMKKPEVEVHNDLISSMKSYDSATEMSLNRRLGIRDLPMPPMPFDTDDDVDEDETDMISEQDLRKKEDDLCDIVKSFVRNKQASTSPAETCQQPHQQYVLTTVHSFVDSSIGYINLHFLKFTYLSLKI